ncbi:uncharacterized protein LOC122507278 [Leptopilina heterotoma]|uniref:uncharacterized protein LOC122507278 n=1 Tax=Leptopilina heterotoma TaxID=63436 RepID=UPI001CA9DE91|nr:uncharacterized protein LOC122507278 [Leptopilina heterotoma]
MTSRRILRSTTRKMREDKETENFADSETETASETDSPPKQNTPGQKDAQNKSHILEATIQRQEAMLRAFMEITPPEKLKLLNFDSSLPLPPKSQQGTANASLPLSKQSDRENAPSANSILQQYYKTVKKTVGNSEKLTENFSEKSKDGTFDINSFIGTNSQMIKDRNELTAYDEMLRIEREKLREKEKRLEIEHRKIVQKKYKPSAHSSVNKNNHNNSDSEDSFRTKLDNYFESDKRKMREKRQNVQFKNKSKNQEFNYEWPNDSEIGIVDEPKSLGTISKEKNINFHQELKEKSAELDQFKNEISIRDKELDQLRLELDRMKITMENVIKNKNPNFEENSTENSEIENPNAQVDNNRHLGNFNNHFPFGMLQTPFQIMSNWPVKFHNNKTDNPVQFLEELFRFMRGYEIPENRVLENIDAVLADEALEWCRTVRHNWFSLQDFREEFERTFLDEKFYEEINTKIKYCNQKEGEEIQTFLIGIRKLFARIYPRKGLQWELRRAYENMRIEYKMYIQRNDFKNFEELESLGKEFEIERNKSKIRGQTLTITTDKKENSTSDKPKQNSNQGNSRGFGGSSKFHSKSSGNYHRKWSNGQPKVTFPPDTTTNGSNGQKMLENSSENPNPENSLQVIIPNHSSAGNGINNAKTNPNGKNNQKNFSNSPKKCYGCGKVGHFRRDCRSENQGNE